MEGGYRWREGIDGGGQGWWPGSVIVLHFP